MRVVPLQPGEGFNFLTSIVWSLYTEIPVNQKKPVPSFLTREGAAEGKAHVHGGYGNSIV